MKRFDEARVRARRRTNRGHCRCVIRTNFGVRMAKIFRENSDSLVDKGAKTDERDENGFTPLHIALYKGNEKIFKLLLENEANINIKNEKNGATLLHFAVERGQTGIVKLLLDKYIKKNEKDKNGFTPLHIAVYKGNEEIIELLIESGIKINEKDQNGYTPLHLAVLTGYKNVVELLLKSGAQIGIKNEKGLTPLRLIFSLEDYTDRVQAFLMSEEKEDRKWPHLVGLTTYKNVVELLLITVGEDDINRMQSPSINKKKEDDQLLRLSILNAQKQIIKLLIKYGAKINENDTAFHSLLAEALNVDDLRQELALLDLAVIKGQIPTVKFLLKNGAQVNLFCVQKLSKIAVPQKKEEIAALLKENVKEKISTLICDYLKHLCPGLKIRVIKQEIELSNQHTGKQLSKDLLIDRLDKIAAKKFTKVYDLLTQIHKDSQLDADIFSNEETRSLLEEYRGNALIKFFIDIRACK